jgi:hypothetical protein
VTLVRYRCPKKADVQPYINADDFMWKFFHAHPRPGK